MIAGRISDQLGVICEIGGLSWSPWAGITVSDVRLLAPEGCGQSGNLVEVDRISVDLSWWSLLSGKRRWERLEVTGVRVDLSLEALQDIMARYERPQPSKPPKPPVAGGGDPDGSLAKNDSPKDGDAPVAPTKKGDDGEEKGPASEKDKAPLVESKPVDRFEGVVVFSEVNLRMYSLKSPDLSVTVTGVNGEIPLWGSDRPGRLAYEKVALGSDLAEKDSTFEVNWQDQSVHLDSGVVKFFGLDVRVRALVRMASGYPFGIQVDVPRQDVDFSPVYQSRQSPLEVHGLISRNVLQGYLMVPASFSGTHFSQFEEVVFHDLSDGGDTRFERGRAAVVASRGGVVARDFRLLGEEEAILMNGFATFGGEAAATVRVVASPNRAESHENRVRRADEGWSLDFQPLVTPDRMFRDLRLEWREGQVMIDLAAERGWVPLWSAMQKVLGRRNTTFSTKPFIPPTKP